MPQPRYRRRWIKWWVQEVLYGTLAKECEPGERWVWAALLALAGDSPIAGKVCIAEGIAFTDQLLSVPLSLLDSARSKLIKTERIHYNGSVLCITNWERYQGEYERLKAWRQKQAKVTEETGGETHNETEKESVSQEKENESPRTEEEEEEEDLIPNTSYLAEQATPVSFDGWVGRVSNARNKQGELLKMLTSLFPSHDWGKETKSHVSRLAMLVRDHGLGQVIGAVWESAARRPLGNPLDFITKALGGKDATHRGGDRRPPIPDRYITPAEARGHGTSKAE